MPHREDITAASITDVARRAGVSVATVSRALRGLPNVAVDTRRRVAEAAEELHYVADPNASRLAAGRTLSVGVLVEDASHWFAAHVLSGAAAVAASTGYDLVLYERQGAGNGFLPSAYHKRIDGLITVVSPQNSALPTSMAASNMPVVAVGGPARDPADPSAMSNLSWVGIDDRAAAAIATGHLVNLGHERIALIGHEPAPDACQAAARRHGYRDALRSAGLPVEADLDVNGGFSLRGGSEAMRRLLAGDCLPTAVFALSDEMAVGAMHTIRSAGLRVPGDVSVVGFDDQDVAVCTGLTTIHQPVRKLGEAAATLLTEGLVAPWKRVGVGNLVPLGTTLCVRSTTGPRRTDRCI